MSWKFVPLQYTKSAGASLERNRKRREHDIKNGLAWPVCTVRIRDASVPLATE